MDSDDILKWLKEDDYDALKTLFNNADRVRRDHVGDQIHFRGLIEFSNICRRGCGYCGIRAQNADVTRYRLTPDEIIRCAEQAEILNFGTVTLQSGEDPGLDLTTLCKTIETIKRQTGLAVTLSIGERSRKELSQLRAAGADRYLLRFETSNPDLYDHVHPPITNQSNYDRFEVLAWLRELGYEVGSGIMVGIPGETWQDLAMDLQMFQKLDLDMIGIGPYIPHPQTPLAHEAKDAGVNQTPNTQLMTLKVLALTRILCPDTNLPSTTALETLNPDDGYEDGLTCGGNVIMPNLTPMKYRELYDIYPHKAGKTRTAEALVERLLENVRMLGRRPGKGPGKSKNYLNRYRCESKGA